MARFGYEVAILGVQSTGRRQFDPEVIDQQ
jgi:hypothetical protein